MVKEALILFLKKNLKIKIESSTPLPDTPNSRCREIAVTLEVCGEKVSESATFFKI